MRRAKRRPRSTPTPLHSRLHCTGHSNSGGTLPHVSERAGVGSRRLSQPPRCFGLYVPARRFGAARPPSAFARHHRGERS